MKYMILLTRESWEDHATDEERARIFSEIRPWFGRLSAQGTLIEGQQLGSPRAATTVVLTDGQAEVIDGPDPDRAHPIGGYGVLDVANAEEAITIAKSFPAPSARLEIRPVLERSSPKPVGRQPLP